MTETIRRDAHARDATLDMPVLMLPSVQVNMRAGTCRTENNGVRYLKIRSTRSERRTPRELDMTTSAS
ncbi:hypothetical protein [Burkholderia cenocepacia]|uniref:hypothetical protein n=1 Tax=Burkholderia cenocepacia TaxID=95486 RepID=UPI001D10AC6F|nr:hypothetical protein [Burkholderia cenocepacia]